MAGSWGDVSNITGGSNRTGIDYLGFEAEFTADASDASIPDLTGNGDEVMNGQYGFMTGIEVVFGAPAPDAIDITVTDADGVPISDDFPISFTGDGRQNLAVPVQFTPGTIIQLSGNSVNGARGTLKIVAFR